MQKHQVCNRIDPIRRKKDAEAIGAWIKENAAPEYYRAYTLGISAGQRVTESIPGCGGRISIDGFRKVLERAAGECGVFGNMGTHTPRKTFGWFYYLEGNSLESLSKIFGHSNTDITAKYIGLTQ